MTSTASSAGLCSRYNGVSRVAAKGPLAPPTAIPLRLPTVNHDVPPADDTALRTGRVVAELASRVHVRLQVTGCSGYVTRNAPWTRLLSIPPARDARPRLNGVLPVIVAVPVIMSIVSLPP